MLFCLTLVTLLDRWNLQIISPHRKAISVIPKIKPYLQNRSFNCYFSIGSDAAIALRFHTMRERNPSLFNSQLINKMWYAAVGGGETLNPSYPSLSKSMQLSIDGEKCELRDAISITCLNIPYYAGGSLPLGISEDYFSSGDGIIEVIGFRNILHCATTLVHLKVIVEM